MATSTAPDGPYTYTYGVGTEGFTPDISLTYSHQAGAGDGNSNYYDPGPTGFAGYVDYLHFKDGFDYWITFNPSAGHGVQVNSFLLEMYNDPSFAGLTPLVSWSLLENNTSGSVLASGSTTLSLSNLSQSVTTSAASYAGPLVLQISFTGADNQGVVAIDNINFGQVATVPEPAAGLLFSCGALGLLFHACRRRACVS